MKGKQAIRLTRRHRERLEEILADNATSARERTRAQVLRMSNLGWSVSAITEAIGASRSSVGRVRGWFRENGLEAAVYDLERSGRPPRISGADVQRVVALACTEPPEGHHRWTVRLLATEAVRRELVPEISRERVRLILRDHELKPWREKNVVRSRTQRRVHRTNGRSPATA